MKNILCIDDIKTNLFTLQAVLESCVEDKYTVFIAESAHEGLNILLKEKIDLILLDVMMPEVDGFACAKMIRSSKKTKEIPIIFVTAKTDDATIEMCYKIGGDDYVNKPFNSVELLARVQFHIELQRKSQLLKEEKLYTQSILDLQENLIIVTDGQSAINANKSLLSFYGLKNLEQFREEYGCICQTFVEGEGLFSLKNQKDDMPWIEKVIALSQSENVLVKISGVEKKVIFTIKIVQFRNYYIITFTDITEMAHHSHQLELAAHFDNLTQVYNRNMLHPLFEKRVSFEEITENNFVLIMFDIDFFKKVNDTYGHLVGDDVLKTLVTIIKKHIRTSDTLIRWGGEEFVLLLDVNIERGLSIANELRKYIEAADFGEAKSITCSFGITEYHEGDTLSSIIKRADDALYEAKEGGRNRVCKG